MPTNFRQLVFRGYSKIETLFNMFQPFFFLVMLVLYTLSSFAPVNGIPVQKHPAKSSLTEECESLSGPEGPNGASSLFQDAGRKV